MSHTVLHVWRVPTRRVPAALVRMATDRLRLAGADGLTFRKLLGTGDGATFMPADADLRTWALLTVWDTRAQALAFEAHPTPRGWRRIATQEWRADLACLRSRGRWSRRAPFEADPTLAGRWEGPVAALTRATIRPSRWRAFWAAVPDVVADLDRHDGPTVRLGVGEAPLGVQGTVSVWPTRAALTDFAHRRRPHRTVVEATPREGWYAEELFARFAVLAERGVLFDVGRTAVHADA